MDYTSYIVNNLANEGIISFDTAFLLTNKSATTEKTNLLPPDITLKPQPQDDEFNKPQSSASVVKNPLWKKLLFTSVIIGSLSLGIFKLKNLFKK